MGSTSYPSLARLPILPLNVGHHINGCSSRYNISLMDRFYQLALTRETIIISRKLFVFA